MVKNSLSNLAKSMNMTIKKISDYKAKKLMKGLFEEYTEAFQNSGPTHDFNSINIFKGWEYTIEGWILKRIDKEVMKHNDFIRITDIKDKHGSIAISYESLNNVDYDDFIEQLIQLGN